MELFVSNVTIDPSKSEFNDHFCEYYFINLNQT